MLKPDGCIIIDGKESADTITCGHCGNVVVVDGDNFASCRMCSTFICLNCEKIGSCTPFEKKLQEMERKSIRNNHYKRLGII
jgi:hypothetical protein